MFGLGRIFARQEAPAAAQPSLPPCDLSGIARENVERLRAPVLKCDPGPMVGGTFLESIGVNKDGKFLTGIQGTIHADDAPHRVLVVSHIKENKLHVQLPGELGEAARQQISEALLFRYTKDLGLPKEKISFSVAEPEVFGASHPALRDVRISQLPDFIYEGIKGEERSFKLNESLGLELWYRDSSKAHFDIVPAQRFFAEASHATVGTIAKNSFVLCPMTEKGAERTAHAGYVELPINEKIFIDSAEEKGRALNLPEGSKLWVQCSTDGVSLRFTADNNEHLMLLRKPQWSLGSRS